MSQEHIITIVQNGAKAAEKPGTAHAQCPTKPGTQQVNSEKCLTKT